MTNPNDNIRQAVKKYLASESLQQSDGDGVIERGCIDNEEVFRVDDRTFDSLLEAGIYCREHDIEIADTPEGVGFKLGGLIVAISETPLDIAEVIRALNDSTDPAYLKAARDLAVAIIADFGK